MTFLVYCGDRTCLNNNKGQCTCRKMALNEQGICMNYSTMLVPSGEINNKEEPIEDKIIEGFKG